MLNKTDVTKENQCTPFYEQRLITDLVAELAIVLNEKALLQDKNSELKLECQELKHKFNNYEQIINEEKDHLVLKLKRSQQIIHEKEIALAEKDVKCLQEQKNFLKEVNELKTTCNKQKDLFGKKELELTKEIKLLKAKISEANKNYTNQKTTLEAYNKKYIIYKAKMKHALGIINTLRVAVEKYEHKPLMITRESQTETRYTTTIHEDCTSFTSLHNTTKNENIILRELFFKSHPSDNEIQTIFFIPDVSNDRSKKVKFT